MCKTRLDYGFPTVMGRGLKDIRAIIGLGGGQALDVAKYFAWRRNLPLFQAPTALSFNAVYSHRSGVRENGKVMDAIAGSVPYDWENE